MQNKRKKQSNAKFITIGIIVLVIIIMLVGSFLLKDRNNEEETPDIKESVSESEEISSESVPEEASESESVPAPESESESAPSEPESVPAPAPSEPESAPAPSEPESVPAPAPSEPESTPAPSEPESKPAPEQEESASFLWDATGEQGNPYLVAVNRVTQTVTVYSKDADGNYTVPSKSMICSTGTDTPVGKFHTTDKYTWRDLFGGVYGQYATRITGHILFHSVPYYSQNKGDLEKDEFNKLGTPASMGCIRLQVKDCKWIYDNCPSGSPIVLYDGDASTDPLGNPGFTKLDTTHPYSGWDPSDPDPSNPWLG